MGVTREEFIGEVSQMFDIYRPSDLVIDQLRGIDLTSVSAPAGMGKDALIIASGLPRVLAETIRDPRMNGGVMEQNGVEVEYEFRGHELDVVLAELKRGEHVQIGMGPGRNSFYGSRIANYPSSGPAVMDLMTSQIEAMRKLSFASMEATYVTAPSYEAWLRRLEARGSFTSEEWIKRRAEAQQSLRDGLEDDRFVFILNDDLTVAAAALHNFATTREYDQAQATQARNAANAILNTLLRS